MAMAAVLWDVLSKAANLVQISGVLVAVGANLLRVPQSKRECDKLERCSRRLHALLQWPTGCGAALLCSEMGGSVTKALVDAAGLVESHKKSTLWCRVRRGGRMATQLRDMQDVIETYRRLLLFINAAKLLQHSTPRPRDHDHPPSASDHTSQSPSVQEVVVTNGTRDAQRANGIGSSKTCKTTDPASHSDFPCMVV